MKLAELILRARLWTGRGLADGKPYCIEPDFESDPEDIASLFANEIVNLLGESQPCGVEPFEVNGDGIIIGDTNTLEFGGKMTPSEARAIAVLLLRAADEAECLS